MQGTSFGGDPAAHHFTRLKSARKQSFLNQKADQKSSYSSKRNYKYVAEEINGTSSSTSTFQPELFVPYRATKFFSSYQHGKSEKFLRNLKGHYYMIRKSIDWKLSIVTHKVWFCKTLKDVTQSNSNSQKVMFMLWRLILYGCVFFRKIVSVSQMVLYIYHTDLTSNPCTA